MKVSTQFWYLFWVQFLGAFLDNFYKSFLLVYLVFEAVSLWGMSAQQLIALGSFLFILPFFLLSTFAGNIATKYERAYLVRYIKIWELALVLLGLYFYQHSHYAGMICILFGLGMQSTFFGPIKYSILPEYVPGHKLLLANGWIELGTFVAILIGSLLGTQSNIFRQTSPLLFSGILVLPPLLGIVCSIFLSPVRIENNQQAIGWNFFSDLRQEMVRFYKDPPVFMTIQGISMFWFNGLWGLTLLPIVTKKVFLASEDLVTVFLSIFTLGIGLGSVLCNRLQGKVALRNWLLLQQGFLFIWLVLLWAMTRYQQPFESVALWIMHPKGIAFALVLLGLSFTLGLYAVPLYTSLQILSNPNERSKAIANNNIYNALYMVIAMTIFFLIADYVEVRENFLIMLDINLIFFAVLLKKFPTNKQI